MIWINGELNDQISVADRSFQYGDGCFSTLLIRHGQIVHWAYHQQRIEQCLTVLGIPCPDWSLIQQWVDIALENQEAVLSGLKIHISRGVGGRGYSVQGIASPMVTISRFAFPDQYSQWQQHGLVLGLCRQRLGLNPLLAGHKHNNRIEQVLLKRELESQGYVDGVVLDLNDQVIETTMANLFWFKQGVLHTPSLDQSGVAGVMRRVVIEEAQVMGTTVEVGCYRLSDLMSADAVFMTNSLLGMAAINAVDGIPIASNDLTRELQKRVLSV
jgi:4-amino-4-deoxychorismate lyase